MTTKTFTIVLMAMLLALLVSTANSQTTLYDNGPNGVGAYSNAALDVLGPGIERFLLDDFTIGPNETWSITDFHWRHIWGTPGIGKVGTGMQMEFFRDNGGTPDLGDSAGTIVNANFSSVDTGEILFSREVIESSVEFDPITLGSGTYWFRATIVGPENNFWMTADQIGNECWVDYNDLGGLQSGSSIFGAAEDINFRIGGSVVPEPGTFGLLAMGSLILLRRRR